MSAPQTIVDAALALPKDDRLDLIQRLIHSVDENDIDWNSWDAAERDELFAECERRWAEYERGEVTPIPHETVMEEIRARLGK
jgi:putative addiction module component (TIGR02574 family)